MCTGVEWEWNEMTRSRDNTQLRGTRVTALCFTGSLTLRTGLWELTGTLLTLNVALLVLPGKLAPQTSNDPHKDWNSHAFFFFLFLLGLMVLWCLFDCAMCIIFPPEISEKEIYFFLMPVICSHGDCLHNGCVALGVTQERGAGVDFSSQKCSLTVHRNGKTCKVKRAQR